MASRTCPPGNLAGKLTAVDSVATAQYFNGLIEQGAGLETLYREVLEPAMRHLGDLWYEDETSDAAVTLGLSRLQLEARRLSAAFALPQHVIKPGHAVLVAPNPSERHSVQASMSSELFWRDGWEASCEFPTSGELLCELVHANWFDVLDLSLSGACRRDHELDAMEILIRTAQSASLNPALAVIVNGRTFFETTHAAFGIGTIAACGTVVDSVATAQRLLDDLANQDGLESITSSAVPRRSLASNDGACPWSSANRGLSKP